MNLYLVSIIIPLYNSEEYIEETIQSALNQTWPNTEIIIVDDGSTDNSLAIARRYENEQVKIFSQPNRGASAARNYGLKEAKGDYIQFLDADDLLSPNKIQLQVEILEINNGSLAFCPTVYFYDEEQHLEKTVEHNKHLISNLVHPVDFLLSLYGANNDGAMITVHSWLTSSSLIKKAGMWNESLTVDDDGEFFCRVILKSKNIQYSPESINYYRKYYSNKSLSSIKNLSSLESLLHSAISKKNHILQISNSEITKRVLARLFTELCYISYPQYKLIAHQSYTLAREFGGLTYKPYFGNKYANKIANYLNWKLSLNFQYFYHHLKGLSKLFDGRDSILCKKLMPKDSSCKY